MANLKPNQFLLDGHIFSEIPLLFQTEMVQAVVTDRKNQTRRTRGLDEMNENPDDWEFCWVGDTVINQKITEFGTFFQHKKDRKQVRFIKSPYSKPGDLLWVRETWGMKNCGWSTLERRYNTILAYRADVEDQDVTWKPSIHMPKAACRIWLMVENIRVERLQDISGDDIFSEGVVVPVSENNTIVFTLGKKNNAIDFLPDGFAAEGQPKLTGNQILFAHWAELWCKVNGRESWDQNPWVWVVKFRTLSKTGRPSDELIVKNWKEVANG